MTLPLTAKNTLVIGYTDPTSGDTESYRVTVLAWRDLENATKALQRLLVKKAVNADWDDSGQMLDLIMDIIGIEPWVITRERVEEV